MHLVEISIFSLNNFIVRPTKIMNMAKKKLGTFLENKGFKNLKMFEEVVFGTVAIR